MKKIFKSAIFYIVLIILVVFIVTRLLSGMNSKPKQYSDIVKYFRDKQVESFTISGSQVLTLTLKDTKEEVKYQIAYMDIFYYDLGDTIQEQLADGTLVSADYQVSSTPWYVTFLPYLGVLLLLIILFVIFYRSMAKNGGGLGNRINNFGKARTQSQDENNKTTFKDVAGADEEKEELVEIVDFLKDPQKYTRLGAKIPHGVLLVGPPGTGKTLLAKAVAGEAGVPFFSIAGSDFVEMYVGVGASRVRDLFDTARKAGSAIIFIDEIDAVGRHRGAGLGGGHDEREQTLNQLLVEMDGFGSHEGIIIMAATNRPDVLDPALLRPGRFDRQITVNYPDISGREAILHVHGRNKPFEPDVDFKEIARTTAGFTGADLANLLNEASLLAARKNKALIGMEEIREAFIKVIAGPKKKSLHIKPEEKRKTAFHEAGHALLAYLLPTQDAVQQISIIPSGRALGYTLNPPEEDRYSEYREELKEEICMLLGGRAAEEIVFQDISGGASNDIERATNIARKMVTRLGMSPTLGPINYAGEETEVFLGRDFSAGADHSEATSALIDQEVHKLISEAYERAKTLLRENREKLDFVAGYLVLREIMDGEQFARAMEEGATYDELDQIKAEREKKSRQANREKAEQDKAAQAEAEKAGETGSDDENTEDPEDPEDTDGMEIMGSESGPDGDDSTNDSGENGNSSPDNYT
ncbi:MAG: ATP-dependent zinc metalloprotease FtsH [Clostridia bacterium]|nr:ATP-dependent zinc metalloprotease FtsH [Clostridia bacterium]